MASGQRGYSLIELLITMAIVAVIAAIALPLYENALVRSHISAAATDAHAIHSAFKRFHMDNSAFPDTATVDLATFEPLVSLDYYDGRLASRLLNGQADGYDSPDDQGANQEFWLEFSLAADPSTRFLVADSDDSLLGGGDYFDGIYLFRNGTLTQL